MIEGNSKNLNPTVEEILDCVIIGQIDARRKWRELWNKNSNR